jgi:hypothetical protein
MRKLPPRERPRRGAGWGSRWASALAAACLAAALLSVSFPERAPAFACGVADRPAQAYFPPRQLQSSQKVVPGGDDCTTPGNRPRAGERAPKKGSMSGLTVFVLAVVAALLIPIGRNGLPRAVDPFGHDRTFVREPD